MTGTSINAKPFLPRMWTLWGSALIHGISQIFFQINGFTGLLILAAFFTEDWRMPILVVLGSLASSAGGRLLGESNARVHNGFQGFCGALVGAATFSALGGQAASYPIAVVGGLLCAPMTWCVNWLFTHKPLAPLRLPPTTAPFCIVATVILVSTPWLHIHEPLGLAAESRPTAFFESLLTNISQVVLVDSVWGGALILLALFVANWKVGVAALIGSTVGSVAAIVLNLGLERTVNGLTGYSGVLTAIAFAVVFVRGKWTPWLLAVWGAAVTAVATLLMEQVVGPTYTWPYILSTWAGLVFVDLVPGLRRAL